MNVCTNRPGEPPCWRHSSARSTGHTCDRCHHLHGCHEAKKCTMPLCIYAGCTIEASHVHVAPPVGMLNPVAVAGEPSRAAGADEREAQLIHGMAVLDGSNNLVPLYRYGPVRRPAGLCPACGWELGPEKPHAENCKVAGIANANPARVAYEPIDLERINVSDAFRRALRAPVLVQEEEYLKALLDEIREGQGDSKFAIFSTPATAPGFTTEDVQRTINLAMTRIGLDHCSRDLDSDGFRLVKLHMSEKRWGEMNSRLQPYIRTADSHPAFGSIWVDYGAGLIPINKYELLPETIEVKLGRVEDSTDRTERRKVLCMAEYKRVEWRRGTTTRVPLTSETETRFRIITN